MLHGAVIALGAFLLFLIQPIAAKILLPWFGGSAAVWSTCLVFFQAALLLGYLYAHWLDRVLRPRTQAYVHAGLVLLAVAMLPLATQFHWRPSGNDDPAAAILLLLTASIGVPYVLLATTSPLLQAWYRDLGQGARPYRFYALSNAGSLLALLAYPLLIEPSIGRRNQAIAWLCGFVVYAACLVPLCLSQRQRQSYRHAVRAEAADSVPPARTRAWWLALTACASMLLVAMTGHITQNLAPAPLLWVVPLSAYLSTFILCFGTESGYRRAVWLPAAALAIGGTLYLSLDTAIETPLWASLAAYVVGLFACCMVCHGELARSRPDARRLTGFYVYCALGGALGSLFAALLAPRIFSGNYELPCALALCALIIMRAVAQRRSTRRQTLAWTAAAGVFVTLTIGYAVLHLHDVSADSRVLARNFYGVLRVTDDTDSQGGRYRELLHGTIIHGIQRLDPARRCEPLAYYGPGSGVGDLLGTVTRTTAAHVGVMGLGSGSMLGLARRGDRFTFYEINPLAVQLAGSEFSFLRDCAEHAEVRLGDARLTLEREANQQFDVLVMDAFSGDSVPAHLLTLEAFELYFRHLKESGVLAVHISNSYVDLQPVLERIAHRFNRDLLLVDAGGDSDLNYPSLWGLISAPGRLDAVDANQPATPVAPASDDLLWTDDFSSLWRVLKWR